MRTRIDDRPNIVMFVTDQQRADSLGIVGHPVVQTPHLDDLAARGCYFSHAYSACPVCIPARRTLMTGTRAATHGVVGNRHTWLDHPTLPDVLADAGYQTHLAGKLHLYPQRKLYGFHSTDWCDGPYPGGTGDYGRFMQREGPDEVDAYLSHGATMNSWLSRPWHLADRLHHTNWTTERALDFLAWRDPTKPFFLKVSYFDPHQPVTPPAFYYERYMEMDLPEPKVGDWAIDAHDSMRGATLNSARAVIAPQFMHQYRAGYYGSINHIDDQIGRILFRFMDRGASNEWGLDMENTIFMFVSDHGEMLGDHHHFKKCQPYEASICIPFFMTLPSSFGLDGGQVCDALVELMDVMPTLLDAVGVEIPPTVEGRSVLPLLQQPETPWREYLHGECAQYDSQVADSGMQFITNGKRKYIWYPSNGTERYFDLVQDPDEMTDRIHDPQYNTEIEAWRARLIEVLQDRPEGFVREGALTVVDAPTPYDIYADER